jgi:uncharacterized membrane protein YdjX (TVP38/TMEM64 family)
MLAATGYVLIYIAAVACSLPGAVYLTLTGGFLFGAAFGTLLTVVGATAGATIVFLFAKTLFGDRVVSRLGTRYPTFVQGVRDHAWCYMLALRFVPLCPFFLVNLIAAFVGVRLSTYVITTIVGILPGTAVFSLSGAGLGTVLEQGGSNSVGSVMTPTVIAALIGLGALSLAAIPVRKRFGKLKAEESLLSRRGHLPVNTEILEGPVFSDVSGSAAAQARDFSAQPLALTSNRNN